MASISSSSQPETRSTSVEYIEREEVPGNIVLVWDVTNFHTIRDDTPESKSANMQLYNITKGGYDWQIWYYPKGVVETDRTYLALYFGPRIHEQEMEVNYDMEIKDGERIVKKMKIPIFLNRKISSKFFSKLIKIIEDIVKSAFPYFGRVFYRKYT